MSKKNFYIKYILGSAILFVNIIFFACKIVKKKGVARKLLLFSEEGNAKNGISARDI
jgi:hypothetical protein